MTTNYLHNLNTKELLSVLRHVQLGHDYLSKKLSKAEYKSLLSIGSLSNNQIEKLENDRQEKIGNVSVVVNTILTSCFGAWLGFNAFNQSSIFSIFGLYTLLLALGFGLLTGYLSYTFTYQQAKLATKNQQLCNVQRIIIEIIIHRRQEKVEKLQKKIVKILSRINSLNFHSLDYSQHRIINSLTEFILSWENKPLPDILKKSLTQIQQSIHKLNKENVNQTSLGLSSFNSSDFLLNNSLTSASYLKILTKTILPSKNQIPKVHGWLRKNLLGVLVGLLPTFLGSFASMFVFLNGVPALLVEMNINLGFSMSQVYMLKKSTLLLAFLVSIYFAFSHIHSNYKTFRRSQQLENAENIIADKMNQMFQAISELNLWSKIYYQLQLTHDFLNFSSSKDSLGVALSELKNNLKLA